MRLIPPLEVTPATLTSSNVAITETEWTAGTYATGTRRYVGTDLYEVVASPSTADSPTAGVIAAPPTWIKVGKINRYRMFDFTIGEATTRASNITVTITPGQIVNALAAFDVGAAGVTVTMTDPVDGVVYSRSLSLVNNLNVSDWYAYFFEPVDRVSEFALTDLPTYGSAAIQLVFTASGTVSIGELVLGAQRNLGVTVQGITVGIEDFSRKERDDFGNIIVVERRFAKLLNADVFVENSEINATLRSLTAVRAKPAVYVGAVDRAETIILGFFRDFSVLRTGPVTSEMTIEIEGLT